MKLIRLCIYAVTKNYFDKLVLNPSKGYYIKGEDKLPEWLTTSTKNMLSIELNSAV